MLGLLVTLLILVLLGGLIWTWLEGAPINERWKWAAKGLFLVICIVVLLSWLPVPLLGPHNRL